MKKLVLFLALFAHTVHALTFNGIPRWLVETPARAMWVDARYSSQRSLSLTGASSMCAKVTDKSAFATGATSTISGWIKGSTQSAATFVLGQYDYGNNQIAQGIWTGPATTTILDYIVSGDGQYVSQIKDYKSSSTFLTGAWVHFAFVFSTNTIAIYKNAVVDGSPTIVQNDTVNSAFNSTAAWTIGCALNSGANANFFTGLVDNAQFWSTALTAGNITTLYNGGVKLDPAVAGIAGLISHWDVRANSTTTTIVDLISGFDLTGTNLVAGSISTDI